MTEQRFDAATLELLDRVREVKVETTALDGTKTRRTIIWIVTAGDEVFIRSVRGTAGRWYREARKRPDIVLHVERASMSASVVLAADPDAIQKVSEAFTAKYGRRSPGSTASMLRPHTLETTLRVDPAQPGPRV